MGGTWGPILLQVVSGWLSELSLPGRCGLSTRGWVRVWVPNANDRPLWQGGSLQPPFAHCPTVRSIKRGWHATGPQQPVWVDLSNGSTQGVPACHRAGAPPKACGRRSARFSSFDRCRCSVEVPALSCASPTRMPLRGQREGACGGAWLARGFDLRRGVRGLLSAGSGGPVVAVFPGLFFLGSSFRGDHSLLCVGGTHHNSSKGDTADPVVWSLFCSGLGDCCPIFALFARGRADRSALTIHLLRSCWDPPFHIWFPGRRCSRGTLRVSSMLSPTNQSAARRLSSGTKNN